MLLGSERLSGTFFCGAGFAACLFPGPQPSLVPKQVSLPLQQAPCREIVQLPRRGRNPIRGADDEARTDPVIARPTFITVLKDNHGFACGCHSWLIQQCASIRKRLSRIAIRQEYWRKGRVCPRDARHHFVRAFLESLSQVARQSRIQDRMQSLGSGRLLACLRRYEGLDPSAAQWNEPFTVTRP